MNRPRSAAGFTLAELMITVAVIAMLAAIAYPNYVNHLQRAKRADARAALLEAAQFLQRFKIANDRYDQDRNGLGFTLPAALSSSPRSGQPAYGIRIVSGSLQQDAYVLEAVPLNPDKCGTLRLDQAGRRTLQAAGDAVTAEECWR